MNIYQLLTDMRAAIKKCKDTGKTIGLVPTMGALHDGHLSLVKKAREQSDFIVTSIFVNPTQFGPDEDFDTYPKTLESDIEKLQAEGCHAVWAPSADEMYPDGFQTTISVPQLANRLDGLHRPGHFDGVATVVTKLLGQITPDIAVFGEKDYQQLQIIRQMVKDLNIPVQIIGAPIQRDDNGLALSSRNRYLNAEDYKIAIQLNTILFDARARIVKGDAYSDIEKQAEKRLIDAGVRSVDYVSIINAETLQPAQQNENEKLRILAAAFVGNTRLIDNIAV